MYLHLNYFQIRNRIYNFIQSLCRKYYDPERSYFNTHMYWAIIPNQSD